MSNKNIGTLVVGIGLVVFIAATGDIIFRVLGIAFAVVAINHGLQMLGKPPLFELLQTWFDQVSR